MITYNHERFISKAIASVVTQRTTFPIEVVIGDDASSDKTSQRIEVFREQYPEIVRALIQPTNVGMHRNLEDVLRECRGEFVAFLDGDDYWISESKLQLQADLLRAHASAVGVFHPVVCVDARGKETGEIDPDRVLTEIGTRELLETNLIPTASVMIRRDALVDLPGRYRNLKMRDWPMWVYASLRGSWRCLPQVMAAYRVQDHGSWSSLSWGAQITAIIELFEMLASDLPPPFRELARQQLARMHLEGLREALIFDRPADACHKSREVLRLLPYFRQRDAKRLASAFWQLLSPRTHSLAKRTLSLIRQNPVQKIT